MKSTQQRYLNERLQEALKLLRFKLGGPNSDYDHDVKSPIAVELQRLRKIEEKIHTQVRRASDRLHLQTAQAVEKRKQVVRHLRFAYDEALMSGDYLRTLTELKAFERCVATMNVRH